MPVQTVLLVSEMKLGEEQAVRRAHEGFPVEALQRGIGVERLIAFIGSGYYALEITVGDGDFQEKFRQFLQTPDIQAFFADLEPFVSNLPFARDETATMPLATAMLRWQRPELADATTV
jgi:hypothetical protein